MALLAQEPHLRPELLFIHDFGADFLIVTLGVWYYNLLAHGGPVISPFEFFELFFLEARLAELLLHKLEILLQVLLFDAPLARLRMLSELGVDPEAICIATDLRFAKSALRYATAHEQFAH